eukprot:331405-Rhodomonas_salina.2
MSGNGGVVAGMHQRFQPVIIDQSCWSMADEKRCAAGLELVVGRRARRFVHAFAYQRAPELGMRASFVLSLAQRIPVSVVPQIRSATSVLSYLSTSPGLMWRLFA